MPTFLQRPLPIINEFQQHIWTTTRVCRRLFSDQVAYHPQKVTHLMENDFSRTFDIDGRMLTGLEFLMLRLSSFFVQRHNLCQFSIVWKFTGVNTLIKNVSLALVESGPGTHFASSIYSFAEGRNLFISII